MKKDKTAGRKKAETRRQNTTQKSALYYLIYVGQLGFSLAAPIILAVCGAAWLRSRLDLGVWVIFAGLAFGLGGASVSFFRFARAAERAAHLAAPAVPFEAQPGERFCRAE